MGESVEAARQDGAVDVLIPTADRPAELAATLAGLAAQTASSGLRIVISDQSSRRPVIDEPAVAAMLRVLERRSAVVDVRAHLPRRGMAEQRQALLERSVAGTVLYLDDDVWLEPEAVALMREALHELGCGFVGMAVQGLSFLGDVRPHEQAAFEPWEGPVTPETMGRDREGFERWRLHNAANLTHIAARTQIPPRGWIAYRIAWVGACTMFRRDALVAAGGFGFWRDLPPDAVGEDVLAQWRVMRTAGGAGLLPSRAVHLESPTTLPDRGVEATVLLP